MALPRTHIPPARKLWSIVEMLKARYSMDDEKLAATAVSQHARFATTVQTPITSRWSGCSATSALN